MAAARCRAGSGSWHGTADGGADEAEVEALGVLQVLLLIGREERQQEVADYFGGEW